jgi:DNA-binding MarR family transcriptional regulator
LETLRPDITQQAIANLAQHFPELDVTAVETCLAFLHATAEVYAALSLHFARYGLSMGKFTLLMQLFQADSDGLTPSECAERTSVTRATITGLLDGLERDGLVKRQSHPRDRRMLQILLTQKGRELLINMLPDHFCRTTGLTANLSTAEKMMLVELLTKLRAGTPAMTNPDFGKSCE